MDSDIKEAIFKTTAYADIFNYPLKKEELWQYLIYNKPQELNFEKFKKSLKKLPAGISFKENYFFLSGRNVLIKKRKNREKESQTKLKIAQKIISKLSLIPTIMLIGISGNLSRMNAEKNDDIDLFLITQKNSLWLTRLLMLIVLLFSGNLRKRSDRIVSNKICPNMLITEDVISFPKEKQDLYTAYEIIQMEPLFERNNIYQKFIKANIWVNGFLPNGFRAVSKKNQKKSGKVFFLPFQSFFELAAKKAQFWYMKKHITTEKISDSILAFHPFDYKNYVQKELEKRLKSRLKIPNTRGH